MKTIIALTILSFSSIAYAHSGEFDTMESRWFINCQDETALPFCGTLRVDMTWLKKFQGQQASVPVVSPSLDRQVDWQSMESESEPKTVSRHKKE